MWFAIVGNRTLHGTTARTRSPVGEAAALEEQHLVVVEPVRVAQLCAHDGSRRARSSRRR